MAVVMMMMVIMVMVMIVVVMVIKMIHALLEMLVNKTSCRTEADIELIIDDEHISRWVIFTKWCEYHRRRKIYLFPLLFSSKSTAPAKHLCFLNLCCVVPLLTPPTPTP